MTFQESPMNSETANELIRLEEEWAAAMVANDAAAIGRYMADDWTIIGPDGTLSDKLSFLGLVQSGALTHDVMETHDINVREYDGAAVLTARGVSGGQYRGHAFREEELVTDVWVRQQGRWRCVHTHLSRLARRP
jgi:ketosteroid isomerase-like protein